MKTSSMESPFVSQQSIAVPHIEPKESVWKPLYKVGGVTALIMTDLMQNEETLSEGTRRGDTT